MQTARSDTVSSRSQRAKQPGPGYSAVGRYIFTDLRDKNGIKSPGDHTDAEQDITEIKVQVDNR